MPLSDNRTPDIQTIPILSSTNTGDYIFDFELPTPPLKTGNNQAQLLWLQLTYAADATVGTRVPVFDVLDDQLNSVFSVASINTQGAGTSVVHSFLQGVVVFPLSITGLIRTWPVNGLYVFDKWRIRFQDLAGISAGDSFAGNFQIRLF